MTLKRILLKLALEIYNLKISCEDTNDEVNDKYESYQKLIKEIKALKEND